MIRPSISSQFVTIDCSWPFSQLRRMHSMLAFSKGFKMHLANSAIEQFDIYQQFIHRYERGSQAVTHRESIMSQGSPAYSCASESSKCDVLHCFAHRGYVESVSILLIQRNSHSQYNDRNGPRNHFACNMRQWSIDSDGTAWISNNHSHRPLCRNLLFGPFLRARTKLGLHPRLSENSYTLSMRFYMILFICSLSVKITSTKSLRFDNAFRRRTDDQKSVWDSNQIIVVSDSCMDRMNFQIHSNQWLVSLIKMFWFQSSQLGWGSDEWKMN
jgi:hypothetical protein